MKAILPMVAVIAMPGCSMLSSLVNSEGGAEIAATAAEVAGVAGSAIPVIGPLVAIAGAGVAGYLRERSKRRRRDMALREIDSVSGSLEALDQVTSAEAMQAVTESLGRGKRATMKERV